MSTTFKSTLAVAALAPTLFLAACSSSTDDSNSAPTATATTIVVTASDTDCIIDQASIPSGPVSFEVTNTGNEITEVYVYGKSGDEFTTVVSEVENIGPGVSRDMSADLAAGDYQVACKPGQTGDGIRASLEVTGDAGTAPASTSIPAREISLSINAKDSLTGVEGQSATTGERIEFAVKNTADSARVFEVKRPDGSVAGETEIQPTKEADLYLDMDVAGTWLLIVEGGKTETETDFSVK
ncbi:MAG: cupredoxin domain-containing protein [Candidatus Nanopelagicales bacterium]